LAFQRRSTPRAMCVTWEYFLTTPAVYHLCAMLSRQTSEQWIAQYATSHQHPVNRACHTLGIPTILFSLVLFLASIFFHRLWLYAAVLILAGMDTPACRPRLRAQGTRISSRLALPLCRSALVVGQDPRQGLTFGQQDSSVPIVKEIATISGRQCFLSWRVSPISACFSFA